MSLPAPSKLPEAVQRVRLSCAEQAELQTYLEQHPEQRPALEQDLRLNELLTEMPDPPLSTNFTSRVLQSASQVERPRVPAWIECAWRGLTHGWAPKVALALCLIGLGLLINHQRQETARIELVRHVAEIHTLTRDDTLDVLQNFEAIQRLVEVQRDPDRELIAALK
jgi:anti-sigma factor RsiW